jgi:hypothetical protein
MTTGYSLGAKMVRVADCDNTNNNSSEWDAEHILSHVGKSSNALFEVRWRAGDVTWLEYDCIKDLPVLQEYQEIQGVTEIEALPRGAGKPPQDNPQVFLSSAGPGTRMGYNSIKPVSGRDSSLDQSQSHPDSALADLHLLAIPVFTMSLIPDTNLPPLGNALFDYTSIDGVAPSAAPLSNESLDIDQLLLNSVGIDTEVTSAEAPTAPPGTIVSSATSQGTTLTVSATELAAVNSMIGRAKEALANGVKSVDAPFECEDHPSYKPWLNVRIGKFDVIRDADGKIISLSVLGHLATFTIGDAVLSFSAGELYGFLTTAERLRSGSSPDEVFGSDIYNRRMYNLVANPCNIVGREENLSVLPCAMVPSSNIQACPPCLTCSPPAFLSARLLLHPPSLERLTLRLRPTLHRLSPLPARCTLSRPVPRCIYP